MDSVLIIVPKRKQLKCPWTQEWINCNKLIKCSIVQWKWINYNCTHWHRQNSQTLHSQREKNINNTSSMIPLTRKQNSNYILFKVASLDDNGIKHSTEINSTGQDDNYLSGQVRARWGGNARGVSEVLTTWVVVREFWLPQLSHLYFCSSSSHKSHSRIIFFFKEQQLLRFGEEGTACTI